MSHTWNTILEQPRVWWRHALLLGAATAYLAFHVVGELRRGVQQPPSQAEVERVALALLACRAAAPPALSSQSSCAREGAALAGLLEVHKPRDLKTGVYVSKFNLYVLDRALIYRRLNCTPEDIAFDLVTLNIHARWVSDLPTQRQSVGFQSFDFSFKQNGARVDGACVAVVRLPTWPIYSIITGEYVRGAGFRWHIDVRN